MGLFWLHARMFEGNTGPMRQNMRALWVSYRTLLIVYVPFLPTYRPLLTVILSKCETLFMKCRANLMGCVRWRKLIGCLKLQVIFRKRATTYRTLLRKMTYEDEASYDFMPPCRALWMSIRRIHSTCRCYVTNFCMCDMTQFRCVG